MKTRAELIKLFNKEVLSKLAKQYMPDVRRLKYIEWLENKIIYPQSDEWIRCEDAMPPLAPESECASGAPYSKTVTVKNDLDQEAEAMYGYEERQWLDLIYERNIEVTYNHDGDIVSERKVIKWKSSPPKAGKGES